MDEELIVNTKQGKLYGAKTTTVLHKTPCYSFCGIPYAKPPLDALRFMPPEPYDKWRGILNATKEKDDCLQFSHIFNMYIGSEDCLYLNIHTPEPPCKIKTPKPVMVLIHPGGNAWGSGSRDSLGNPDFLVPNDIILVTFNFRLNVFGFLSLGIASCPGNMGLKDQVMVLHWVQDNISSFGGDPKNVTLAGCSAASCDVHFHLMSPLIKGKGLFHRVIMQSGFAGNSNWSYITPELSYERAVILAQELGFKGGTTARKICSFLKTKTAMELAEGVAKLKSHIKNTNPEKYEAVQFLPTAEFEHEGAFLTALPRELMYTIEPIPIICSIVRKEGLIAFCTKPTETVRGNLEKVVRDGLSLYNIDDKTLKYITRKIRSFYFGEREINDDVLEDIVNMFTDLWFCEWYDMINYFATLPNAQPVYVYEFAFFGKFNFQRRAYAENAPDWLVGACHADDTSYVTYYKALTELFRDTAFFEDRETKVIKNLNILLTNFVKTGDPNGGTSDEIEWRPHYPDDPSHIVVDDNLTVVNSRINEERYKFWDELMEVIKECEKRLKENPSSP